MKKVLNPNFQAGSTNNHEPRLVGDILTEMFSSNSPLSRLPPAPVGLPQHRALRRPQAPHTRAWSHSPWQLS